MLNLSLEAQWSKVRDTVPRCVSRAVLSYLSGRERMWGRRQTDGYLSGTDREKRVRQETDRWIPVRDRQREKSETGDRHGYLSGTDREQESETGDRQMDICQGQRQTQRVRQETQMDRKRETGESIYGLLRKNAKIFPIVSLVILNKDCHPSLGWFLIRLVGMVILRVTCLGDERGLWSEYRCVSIKVRYSDNTQVSYMPHYAKQMNINHQGGKTQVSYLEADEDYRQGGNFQGLPELLIDINLKDDQW